MYAFHLCCAVQYCIVLFCYLLPSAVLHCSVPYSSATFPFAVLCFSVLHQTTCCESTVSFRNVPSSGMLSVLFFNTLLSSDRHTCVTIDCLLRYVRVVSLSSAPGCEPDIVTQLVEKVGDVIGDWLSGAKKSILGREILDSVERSRTTRRHDTAGDIKKRNKAKSKIGRKDSVKTAEESPPMSRGTDIKTVPDEKDAQTIGDSKKSKKNQKKRRSYFGSKDRPNGDRNRSSEESENRATREDSRHDGAGRKIFVCSGRSIDSPMLS